MKTLIEILVVTIVMFGLACAYAPVRQREELRHAKQVAEAVAAVQCKPAVSP